MVYLKESVIEGDKKDYQDESDYGFPDEIENLTFQTSLNSIDIQQLQNKFETIETFYTEMRESIELFNVFWSNIQRNMNSLFSEQEILELQENSDDIIQYIDQKLPSINYFIKQYPESHKKEHFIVNTIQDFLKYNPNLNLSQDKQRLFSIQIKTMLENLTDKHNSLQENLRNNIKFIFDSISNVVTAYPNYS